MGDFSKLLETLPELQPMAKLEIYQDPQGIQITVVTPLSGSPTQFLSALEVQTNQGPMRMQFSIEAVTITEAAAGWRAAAQEALKKFGEQMKENERRIVLPGNPAANSRPYKGMN